MSRPLPPPIDPERVAAALLSARSLELVSCRRLQTLWAGYGYICEVEARALTDESAARTGALFPVTRDSEKKRGEGGGGRKGDVFPLILKLICPPPGGGGAEGAGVEVDEDEGHLRKMLSYEVEQYFYDAVAPRLLKDEQEEEEEEATVARIVVSTSDDDVAERAGAGDPILSSGGRPRLMATVMTDLRPAFPVAGQKRTVLAERQVYAALDWLGAFHRRSWRWMQQTPTSTSTSTAGGLLEDLVLPPLEEAARRRERRAHGRSEKGEAEEEPVAKGVWLNGGYTYLATRRKEFAGLAAEGEDSEWARALCYRSTTTAAAAGAAGAGERRSTCVAELVARFLTPRGSRPFETYIHGDVKSENLFTTSDGARVAFFDFQYVGLGLGVCDLAKLFTCSVPLPLLTTATDEEEEIAERLAMDEGEKRLLEYYRARLLLREGEEYYSWAEFVRHWETALVDWHRFQISWGQWGNSDWLEARVRCILEDEDWRKWLHENQ